MNAAPAIPAIPVLNHSPHVLAPAGAVHEQVNGDCNGERDDHHEQAVDRQFHQIGHLEGAHHPFRKINAHFAGTKDGAVGLLHDQAQPPGGQQGIEWPVVEMPYHQPLNECSQGSAYQKGQDDGEEEVTAKQSGQVGLEKTRRQVGGVGTEDHEFPMGHVDHAHLTKNDGQAHCHQYEH